MLTGIKKLTKKLLGEEQCHCPVCGNDIPHFDPLPKFYWDEAKKNGYKYSFDDAETLNYNAYLCPKCQCSDRDRLYALYLEKYLAPSSGNFTFIDFAPFKALSAYIRSHYPDINYRTADLFAKDVDDVADITNLKDIYKDKSVDFFICSHVLEHVTDAKKALSELHRILKPRGKAILMVPIVLSLKENQEDPNITSPEDRWKHYGQDDHLRIYSKNGFIADVKNAGFKVEELTVKDFGKSIFTKYGISEKSVLYIVSK
jgi:SAM-dependent methyltransferase